MTRHRYTRLGDQRQGFISQCNCCGNKFHCFYLLLIGFLLLTLALVHLSNPYLVSNSITDLAHVKELILVDETRESSSKNHEAAIVEYELHKYQTKYRESECQGKYHGRYTWMTAVYTKDAIVGSLVLAHMLDKVSCIRRKVAVISESIGKEDREVLEKAGFKIKELPGLHCDKSGDARHHHTVLGAWNMTEYDKIVFLDPATFPILSLDDVFDSIEGGKIAAPYCSSPGVIDLCFSSSLFGFQPDFATYIDLLSDYKNRSFYSCLGFQSILWYFFTSEERWIKLPYSYNAKKERSFPMRSYNFAESKHSRLGRVWEWPGKPTRQDAAGLDAPLSTSEDIYRFWWKNLYECLEKLELWYWWHENNVYTNFRHSDPLRDFRAVDIF